jgi:hypothetical protein
VISNRFGNKDHLGVLMAFQFIRPVVIVLVAVCVLAIPVIACIAYVQRDLIEVQSEVQEWVHGKQPLNQFTELSHEDRGLAVVALLGYFSDSDPEVVHRAGESVRILLTGQNPLEPENAQIALSAAIRLHRQWGSLGVQARKESLQLAIQLVRTHLKGWSPHAPTVIDSAGDILLRCLDDESSELRLSALQEVPGLWQLPETDGVARFLVRDWMSEAYVRSCRSFLSVEPQLRSAAAWVAATAPFAEHDWDLAKLLRDSDKKVREATLRALASNSQNRLHGNRQREPVLPYLVSTDTQLQTAARTVLRQGNLSDELIDVLAALQSSESSRRASIVNMIDRLRKIGQDHQADAALLALAQDSEASVRLAFINAVDSKSSASILAQIVSLSQSDPDEQVRKAARRKMPKSKTEPR